MYRLKQKKNGAKMKRPSRGPGEASITEKKLVSKCNIAEI